MQKDRKRMTNSKTILLGFAVIILVGALLLMLPFATKEGQETTFSGALFTAVSSTCVTGLVVYDTWAHWTLFGQLVLLTLIQIGGLGFITIGTFVMVALRKKIGLSARTLIQESLSTLQIQGSVKLVRRIIFGTLIVLPIIFSSIVLKNIRDILFQLLICPKSQSQHNYK